MTAEELAERIRRRKKRLRNITVAQVIFANLVYKRYELSPTNVDLLDKDQTQLSAIILGGDTDQVDVVDRSADRG